MWLDAVKSGAIPKNVEQLNWFLESINAPEIEEDDLPEEPETMPEEADEADNGNIDLPDDDTDDSGDNEGVSRDGDNAQST